MEHKRSCAFRLLFVLVATVLVSCLHVAHNSQSLSSSSVSVPPGKNSICCRRSVEHREVFYVFSVILTGCRSVKHEINIRSLTHSTLSSSIFFPVHCSFECIFSIHSYKQKYRITKRVGGGSFGDIYLGVGANCEKV